MSSLYDKLGVEGRALLRGKGGGEQAFSGNFNFINEAPQELDYVIDELRNPKPDLTINKVLGYMYNYLPYIKRQRNLGLVLSSFLNNTVCFGVNGTVSPPSFEELYPIIEVFKLIVDKKLKVSQPTLQVKEFYSIIGRELEHFVAFNPIANSWKVLPILCGIFLSNQLRDELYTNSNWFKYNWFFQEWDSKMKNLFVNSLQYSLSKTHSQTILNLSITSLALVYQRNVENVKTYTSKIDDRFMANTLVDMIFADPQISMIVYQKYFYLNPNDPEVETITQKQILNKPVIKHLNRFAFLLAAYLSSLKFDMARAELVDEILQKITNFNQNLSQTCSSSIFNSFNASKENNPLFQSFWHFMKNLLFAEIAIFQGLFTRFLTGNNKSSMIWFNRRDLALVDREGRAVALKVIPNLYYLNFILLSVGQGGFDSYNFVYYLSIELALGTKEYFKQLTMQLIGNYQEVNMYPDVLNHNHLMQSKVLFVLGLWENFLQSKNMHDEKFAKEIYNIVKSLADDRQYMNDDLIEASHSVLLFYFAHNEKNVNLADCIDYVNILIKQFPSRISATQLCIAIETIGKKILSNPQPYPLGAKFLSSADEFFQFLVDQCVPIQTGLSIKKPEENPNFSSAQPIAQIEANATLNTLEQDKRLQNDVINENKAKKPKDKVVGDLLLPHRRSAEYEFKQRFIPETVREAAVLALINLVPYFPISVFISWLEKIWKLIINSDPLEKEYLIGMLWKVLSDSLDSNRVELAIRWWYNDKRVPEASYAKM
ncbi:hypothetical protein KGF56_000571 [Candida oxycetoniae]|uniref:Peroxisomal biogenesis factor 8 n=1 Tax=Candida oxycetoniae TaxID=497107 RepID=A0AAI9T1I0_9ASCO|nr:uncharacterized protein KGF56_000571 [Candida oxycetoniae]KAI3406725.2 hypothetical protein KGF56_000571 [Candida oxycetoniae]